jgi:hypothetical protein
MALTAHLVGAREGDGEGLPQLRVIVGLASDIAGHPAEAGAQEFELAFAALELHGVSVAPSHKRRPFCIPDIGLAQQHAVLSGLAAEHDDRLVHQLGIGREGHVLGLHYGVLCNPLLVLGGQRAGLVCHR